MAKIQDIDIPHLEFAEGAAPSTPASGIVRIYAKADGLLYSKDDAGTETAVTGAGGGGAVATDVIWNAAGDLAVGTGSDTAARLAIGAAGGALTVINSAVAWNSGTSFPGSAVTGDRYWRTDRRLEYFYDGTRWLTTTLFDFYMGSWNGITSSGPEIFSASPAAVDSYDFWMEDLITDMQAASGLSGSAYWTITLYKYDSSSATSVAVASSVSNTNAQHTIEVVTIDALLGGNTYRALSVYPAKVSTPGAFIGGARLTGRYVG